jgi:hypothetical protein
LVSDGKAGDVPREPLVCGRKLEAGEVEVLVELVPLGGIVMLET